MQFLKKVLDLVRQQLLKPLVSPFEGAVRAINLASYRTLTKKRG